MAQRTSPRLPGEKLNILGPKLRALREKTGIKQIELAYRLQRAGWDIDPVTANRIETGMRTLTDVELLLILKVLGKRLQDLNG
jgi:transcriptional regulator with XRE-family HTH domain